MPVDPLELSRRRNAIKAYAGSSLNDNEVDQLNDEFAEWSPEEFNSQFSQGQGGGGQDQPPAGPAKKPSLQQTYTPSVSAKKPTGYGNAIQAKPEDEQNPNAITDYTSKLTPGPRNINRTNQEFQVEHQMLANSRNEFEDFLGEMNNNFERLDPVGRAQFTEIQKRMSGLQKAKDRHLKPMEYLRAIDALHEQAKQYRWQSHFVAPGGQLGDQVERNGVVHTRTDKGLEPTAYTAQYIKENTVPAGRGQLSIPTMPGKPNQIVKEEVGDRDIAGEAQVYKELSSEFDDQFGKVTKLWSESHPLEQPNPDDIQKFRDDALAHVVARRKMLMNAAKSVYDADLRKGDKEAVGTGTKDPFEAEKQQREMKDRETIARQLFEQNKKPKAAKAAEAFSALMALREPGSKSKVTENKPIKTIQSKADLAGLQEGDVVQKSDGTKATFKGGKFYPMK